MGASCACASLGWVGVSVYFCDAAPAHQELAVNFIIRNGSREFYFDACYLCEPFDLDAEEGFY